MKKKILRWVQLVPFHSGAQTHWLGPIQILFCPQLGIQTANYIFKRERKKKFKIKN